mmetsp:Transcript_17543/g.48112  ORF Transcript_17543/g.48112 Transcript_17543/m.48112 type:complete len:419 (-) Transcript_17543:62-1318(-)
MPVGMGCGMPVGMGCGMPVGMGCAMPIGTNDSAGANAMMSGMPHAMMAAMRSMSANMQSIVEHMQGTSGRMSGMDGQASAAMARMVAQMPQIPGMVLVPSNVGMAVMGMRGMQMVQAGGCPVMTQSSDAAPAPPIKQLPAEDPETIDAAVQELGDYFNIEERWIKRLNETMKKRKDTMAEDLAKLYEVLEHARSPTGLLTVKIGEMECGQFVGKIKPDKDVAALARKYKLDEHVKSRITELVVRRKATKEEDLETFGQHLKYSKRPSAMAMILVGKLLEGELDRLPDLAEAENLMRKYRLDEDAKCKLAEILRCRPKDQEEVLGKLRKHMDGSGNPSSVVCRVASTLIDGGTLKDPPPKPAGHQASGDRCRERERDQAHGDRGRDRDRDQGRENDLGRDRHAPRDRRPRSRSHSRYRD